MTPTASLEVFLEKSSKSKKLKALACMLRARFVDEKMEKLVRQNKGGTFHISTKGHEMIGVMSAQALIAGKDWAFPYYRDRAFAIGLGCKLSHLFGAFLGREVPHHSGGRMMPDHFSHKELRIPCQSSVVGSQFLQATGVAHAAQLAGRDEVVYVSGGDGSTAQGDFYEALNFACLGKLKVLFVIQDNGFAISVPYLEQSAAPTIAANFRQFTNLNLYEIDGCDHQKVADSLSAALHQTRTGEGPSLVIARVPRIGSHSSSDDQSKYKSATIMQEERLRDPLPRFEQELLEEELLTEAELAELKESIKAEVEKSAVEGEQFLPQSPEKVLNHRTAPSPVIPLETPEKRGESVVMMDALNHGLDEEMARDEGVILFGQDVAREKGGVFGITRGLTQKYGSARCMNSPLAESTIIGVGIGLSIHSCFKPVLEIQFADYLWTGFNQLYNELSSIHYRSNGEWNCPLVIRMPVGGYIQGGPYHSQSIEAFLAHCPGLTVVFPSNSADAKMLLKSSIRDPNPILFLEHKALYRQRAFAARPEPTKEELLPLGKAHIVRTGESLTLISWGLMVQLAVETAEKLQREEGISVEVIDLRTIAPLDMATLLTSVEKTSKVLILHEAPLTCGFGAEIAARLAESAFDHLDAPIKRLGALDCCVPYAKQLEEAVLPQKRQVEEAVRALARY